MTRQFNYTIMSSSLLPDEKIDHVALDIHDIECSTNKWIKLNGIQNGEVLFDNETGTILEVSPDVTEARIPVNISGMPVTAIAEFAFFDCVNLHTLFIPEGVVIIGDSAFQNCTNLKDVHLPYSLNTIGESAFYNCSKLKYIYIPSGVCKIGYNAFSYCTSLSSISLPLSITSLSSTYSTNGVFYGSTKLSTIYYEGDALDWAQLGMKTDATIMYGVSPDFDIPINKNLQTIEWIQLESGGQILFDSKLGAILDATLDVTIAIIPEMINEHPVKMIADYAFYNCSHLTYVAIAPSVTSIGYNSFSYCNHLETIYIPSSITSLATIHANYCAFYNSNNIRTVYYEGDEIEWQALGITFSETVNIFYNTVPEIVIYTSRHGAEWISIVNGEETIIHVLYKTLADTKISMPDVNSLMANLDRKFSFHSRSNKIKTTNVSVNFGSIKREPRVEKKVESVANISDIIESLDSESVESKNSTLIKLNDSDSHPRSVDTNEVEYCEESLIVSLNKQIYFDSKSAMLEDKYNTPKEINIDNDKILINPDSDDISQLDPIHIRTTVIENSDLINVDDKILFDPVLGSIIEIDPCVTEVEIPARINGVAVRSINDYAFSNCSQLEKVIFSSGISIIGDSAFQNCTKLQSVILPSTLIKIGDYAFYNCSKLQELILPEGLVILGSNVFSNCFSLTSINIPSTLISLFAKYNSASAFYNTPNLEIVYYSGNSTTWAELNLPLSAEINSKITFTKTETTEVNNNLWVAKVSGGQILFNKEAGRIVEVSSNAKSIVIPSMIDGVAVTSIGEYAFVKCYKLSQVSISSGILFIGQGAFQNCITLENVSLPNTLLAIADQAFYNCVKLTYVSLPSGLLMLGQNSFAQCKKLKAISVPKSILTMFNKYESHSAFYESDNISIINYEGTESQWLALGSTFATKVEIAYNVKFTNENEWTTVKGIEGGRIKFSGGVILDCESTIISVVIPDKINNQTVLSINSDAFSKLTLSEITLPSSLIQISANAFNNEVLKVITYAGSADSWEDMNVELPDNISIITNCGWIVVTGLGRVQFDSSILTITKLKTNRTQVRIPTSIANQTVIAVGNEFIFESDKLEEVVFPIIAVSKHAFFKAPNINAVIYSGSSDQWAAMNVELPENALLGCLKRTFSSNKKSF
ncbi:MAG: hypothetical protein ATN31_07950 [Candidatus Epulonipiscioides saccharophilum]|nr:MAG: hypothetical protein ATN31_07950 [Epulopiscium sp. AS2M-Bin001]